jgi:hypothetical protein
MAAMRKSWVMAVLGEHQPAALRLRHQMHLAIL